VGTTIKVMLTSDVRLFHRLEGAEGAPVVVLSNSLGTHHAMWDAQIPALTRAFRILRYDTRGHGRSDVPPGPYTLAMLGQDVLRLLDELGVPRVNFCGLSLGGMTGLWLAAHAPRRVGRLVIASTSSYVGSPEVWNARIQAVTRGGMAAVTEAILERWFTPEYRAAMPAEIERIRRMLLTTPADGYIACASAVRDMDLGGDLAAVRCPTLVISGARDPALPPSHGAFIAEHVTGARSIELAAMHLSNIEARDAFTAALMSFLEE
jgi:3-oxoadipate enol-lactonase